MAAGSGNGSKEPGPGTGLSGGLAKPAAEAGAETYRSAGEARDLVNAADHYTDKKADMRLSRKLQEHLGRQLRASYGELVTAPVPDRFVRLLQELESKEDEKKS
jgi:hypothetical protein